VRSHHKTLIVSRPPGASFEGLLGDLPKGIVSTAQQSPSLGAEALRSLGALLPVWQNVPMPNR